MKLHRETKAAGVSTILLVTIVIASLFAGGLLSYSISYLAISEEIGTLQDQLSALQQQISALQSTQNVTYHVTYVQGENTSLSQLYEQLKESIVVVRGIMVQYDFFGRPYYAQVQGSGFVYNFTGQVVIITNYHVVNDAINITVTLANGNGYAASALGSDPYADLAVLSIDAPPNELEPLDTTQPFRHLQFSPQNALTWASQGSR